MLLTLLQEVYYLAKFRNAIKKTNLGEASKYLDLHKQKSDAIEVDIKTTMSDAREDMRNQKLLMDNLIDKL